MGKTVFFLQSGLDTVFRCASKPLGLLFKVKKQLEDLATLSPLEELKELTQMIENLTIRVISVITGLSNTASIKE